ncbi:14627_t:CDS:1, partial [Dentiscutata erythropus]
SPLLPRSQFNGSSIEKLNEGKLEEWLRSTATLSFSHVKKKRVSD